MRKSPVGAKREVNYKGVGGEKGKNTVETYCSDYHLEPKQAIEGLCASHIDLFVRRKSTCPKKISNA